MPPSPYLRSEWTDCAEIWYAVTDPLGRRFTVVDDGVQPRLSTAAFSRAFLSLLIFGLGVLILTPTPTTRAKVAETAIRARVNYAVYTGPGICTHERTCSSASL